LTKTALGTFAVRGDLSITGVTFAGATFTHTVNGNVSNTGTHTVTTGNITLSGGSTAHSLTGAGTYANLILNDAIGATLGGSPIISGTLTLSSGTFAVGANTLSLNGPTIAGTPANFSTTASSSLNFGGSSPGVSIPSSVTQLDNLTLDNINGITLSGSPTVNGTLTLTNGNLNTTPANTLTIASAGSISGATTSRHVVGNLARVFPATAGTSFAYAVGDGTNYTPVTITFPAAPTTGSLTVSTPSSPAADHPDTTGETSGIDASKSINRYWTLKGSTLNGTCTAALTYISGIPVDRDSGATAANFIIRRGTTCSGSGGGRTCTGWGLLTLSGVPNNTLATATGISISSGDPESDFVVGEVAITRFSREKEFIYSRELY
jgi:MSHA biogenesis protein MshQ